MMEYLTRMMVVFDLCYHPFIINRAHFFSLKILKMEQKQKCQMVLSMSRQRSVCQGLLCIVFSLLSFSLFCDIFLFG